MKLRKLSTMVVLIVLTSLYAPATYGGLFGSILKAGKGTARSASVRAISKAEILAASAAIPAGAIFVEVQGPKLVFELFKDGAGAMSGTTDDILGSVKKFNDALGHGLKKSFVLTPDGAARMGDKLESLAAAGPVYIADPIVGPRPLIMRVENNTKLFFRQLEPGLAVPIDAEISADVLAALQASAKLEDLHVASMFASSDVDAVRAIASAAGDRLLSANSLSEAIRSGSLETFQGKTLIVVGHIEDGAFVARKADGTISHTLEIEQLEKMADDAGVTIISAGCSSFCQGSKMGFAEAVTDVGVAAGVAKALKSSTLGDMLGAFGQDTPLIVSQASLARFAETRKLDLMRNARHSGTLKAGSTAMRVFSPVARPGFLLSTLQILNGLYVTGAILMVFMFRSSRSAYIRVFPKLPSGMLPAEQTRHLVFRVLRELLFFALAPIFLSITAVTFFFGGWSSRHEFLSLFWNLVRRPVPTSLRVIRLTAAFALGFIALCFVYSVALALLSAPGFYMVGSAISYFSGSFLSWIFALLAFGYCVFALWVAIRWHRKLWAKLGV